MVAKANRELVLRCKHASFKLEQLIGEESAQKEIKLTETELQKKNQEKIYIIITYSFQREKKEIFEIFDEYSKGRVKYLEIIQHGALVGSQSTEERKCSLLREFFFQNLNWKATQPTVSHTENPRKGGKVLGESVNIYRCEGKRDGEKREKKDTN